MESQGFTHYDVMPAALESVLEIIKDLCESKDCDGLSKEINKLLYSSHRMELIKEEIIKVVNKSGLMQGKPKPQANPTPRIKVNPCYIPNTGRVHQTFTAALFFTESGIWDSFAKDEKSLASEGFRPCEFCRYALAKFPDHCEALAKIVPNWQKAVSNSLSWVVDGLGSGIDYGEVLSRIFPNVERACYRKYRVKAIYQTNGTIWGKLF